VRQHKVRQTTVCETLLFCNACPELEETVLIFTCFRLILNYPRRDLSKGSCEAEEGRLKRYMGH
jgi:hypothetical protein